MNDSALPTAPLAQAEEALQAQPVAAPPTAGQMLSNARRAVGLSLEELAARVKLPVPRLQALEDDRFADWPDITMLRAVAASVCRHVRLDPAVVLARLPKPEKRVWSVAASDANPGFRDKGGFPWRNQGARARLPLAWLALALVIAAVALYFAPALQTWVPQAWTQQHLSAAPAPMAVPEPVMPPDAGPTDTRLGVSSPEPSASAPVAVVPPASASTAAVGVGAAVPAPPPTPAKAVASASVSGTLAGAPAIPLLVFKARALTWVAVVDANGVTLLRKTLAAGETASTSSASAALPLWVVVGRADDTEVEVRGQRIKLEPGAADNVARFKVQ